MASRFGLAAWTDDPSDGLTVYRPDGRERLRVLAGKPIRTAQAVRGYLYVDADGRIRSTCAPGGSSGPLTTDATIVTPTIASIP